MQMKLGMANIFYQEKRMKKGVLVVLAAVVALSLGSCMKSSEVSIPKDSASAAAAGTEQSVITIRVGLGGPKTLPSYKAMEEILVNDLGVKTNGHLKFELYPASQLGSDVQVIAAVRSGVLEMASCATAPLVGLVKEFAIFDTPFLFTSADTAHKILDGDIGNTIVDLIGEKDIYLLGWSELGFRHLTNSVRDVRTPADIKGLKIRTMENPIHLATWRALGANPTPMPISEVYTAIHQKAIDGQENPVAAFFGWKIHEINKHISLTGHVYSPQTFIFSKKILDTLSKEDQDLIREYVKKAALRAREINREQEGDYLSKIKDSGATVIELTTEEKAAFQEATKTIWNTVGDTVGADFMNKLKSELAKANG